MEDRRIGDWMQTYTGGQFWPLDPREEDINIVDIAHALSLICRFNGQCSTFYSVAEHSCRVAATLPTGHLRFFGLLHDAEEAYLGDTVRPIKRLPEWGAARAVEKRLRNMILTKFVGRFWLPDEHAAVKHADNVLLATERRDLMAAPPAPWIELPPPLAEPITPWSSREAKHHFLYCFYDYSKELAR